MRGIGIRVVSNHTIYYCIFEVNDDNQYNMLDLGKIKIPGKLVKPEYLAVVRCNIIDILTSYKIEAACIRLAESTATVTGTFLDRVNIEGVIQESISSSPVKNLLAGQISELAASMKIKRPDFRKYVDANIEFEYIPDGYIWEKSFSKEERESILCAFISLKLAA